MWSQAFLLVIATSLVSSTSTEEEEKCKSTDTHCEFLLEIHERITMTNTNGEYFASKGKLYHEGADPNKDSPVG